MNSGSTRRWVKCELMTGVVVLALALAMAFQWRLRRNRSLEASTAPVPPHSLEEILEEVTGLQPSALAHIDIGLMNLLCAEGLAGAEGVDAGQCLRTLEQWAIRVRAETERNWPLFQRDQE